MIGLLLAAALGGGLDQTPRIQCDFQLVAAWDRKATPEDQKAAKSFMLPKAETKNGRYSLIVDFAAKVITVQSKGQDPFRLNGTHPMIEQKIAQAADVQLLSFSAAGEDFGKSSCMASNAANDCKALIHSTFARGPKGFADMMVFVSPPLLAGTLDPILTHWQAFGDCKNFRTLAA